VGTVKHRKKFVSLVLMAPLSACSAQWGADQTDEPVREGCPAGGMTHFIGVEVRFPPQRCQITLAEAIDGHVFEYDLSVESDLVGVIPRPAGNCGSTGPGGLLWEEKVVGDNAAYFACQTPAASPTGEVRMTLRQGIYRGFVAWNGKNGDVSSPGAPFMPGTISFEVRAVGEYDLQGTLQPFAVQGTMEVALRP
jgi:hypothetical protein